MLIDMDELKENIERFLKVFKEQLDVIHNTDFKKSNSLFRKVLYNGLIDALSKTTAHPRKSNRERIVAFVRKFGDWSSCDKISLPHLVKLLGKTPDPEFSRLREYAFALIDKWIEGEIVSLDRDPDYRDVRELWPREIPKPLEDIKLDFLQHANLFYEYRNTLVHELREPGYGMEFKSATEPFYHSMTDFDSSKKTWELVYPLGFYNRICETALEVLKEYYLKQRIDPYSCYSFGTYWIEELNK